MGGRRARVTCGWIYAKEAGRAFVRTRIGAVRAPSYRLFVISVFTKTESPASLGILQSLDTSRRKVRALRTVVSRKRLRRVNR